MSVSHAPNHAPAAQPWADKDIKERLMRETPDTPKGVVEGLAATLLECVTAGAGLTDAKDRKAFLKDLVGNLDAIQSGVLARVKDDPDYNALLKGQFRALEKAVQGSLKQGNVEAGVETFLTTLEKNKWTPEDVSVLSNHIQKQWKHWEPPADEEAASVDADQKKNDSNDEPLKVEALDAGPSGTEGGDPVHELLQATSSLANDASGVERKVFGQLHHMITEQVKAH